MLGNLLVIREFGFFLWCKHLMMVLPSSAYIPQIRFVDNTDPAGIDHQIAQLGPELASTLVIVISKVLWTLCILFTILLMSVHERCLLT